MFCWALMCDQGLCALYTTKNLAIQGLRTKFPNNEFHISNIKETFIMIDVLEIDEMFSIMQCKIIDSL